MADHNGSLTRFYADYEKALDNHEAALFVGAGLSMAAGFKSWPNLLRGVAAELKLDVDKETDLVTLAQFHVNEHRVRTRLNQLVVDEYGQDVTPTINHQLIVTLPIETVWTTNYDQLIERAFREAGKKYDAKVTSANFGVTVRGKDVTIYKMHGDVTCPDDTVLVRDDYEFYNVRREVFTNALKGDLVNKTFLFLGFSFTDPNIDYILSRIRVLMGPNPRQHYCVMRWPRKPMGRGKGYAEARAQYDYNLRRLELRVGDMKRYGIETLMVDEHDEITDILRALNKRAHRNNIFVSGSTDAAPTVVGRRSEALARAAGLEIVRKGFTLVSGFGLGIGGAVLIGALEEVYRNEKLTLADRILMRPFPQLAPDDPRRAPLYTAYRKEMLSQVGYTIFLGGNKVDVATGRSDVAGGVLEEFALATELGKYPIPVGATGDAARIIWEQVVADTGRFFPGIDVSTHLQVLGDVLKTDEDILAAIFAIIDQTRGT